MVTGLGYGALVLVAIASSACGVDGRTLGVVDATSLDTEFQGSRPTLPDGGDPTGDGDPGSLADAGATGATLSPVGESVPADPLLTAFAATPLPSDEPDCLVSNQRIAGKDDAQSVYVRGGAYLGWAEWREGTYGSCEGAQWVRFHLQLALPGPLELRYLVADGTPTVVGYDWSEGLPGRLNSTDAEVIHDGPILRDPRVICALLAIPGVPRAEWPVFGLYDPQTPLQNVIEGTLC